MTSRANLNATSPATVVGERPPSLPSTCVNPFDVDSSLSSQLAKDRREQAADDVRGLKNPFGDAEEEAAAVEPEAEEGYDDRLNPFSEGFDAEERRGRGGEDYNDNLNPFL